jgi:hypothetical protein
MNRHSSPRATEFPPGLAEKLDSGDTQRDPLTFLLDLVARHGDLVRFEKIYWAPTHLLNSPEHIGSVGSSPSGVRQIAGSLARRVFLSPRS